MTQLREFLQEVMPEQKKRYDFRGKEVKNRIKEINKETEWLERQQADCFMQVLYGNGEASEGGAA